MFLGSALVEHEELMAESSAHGKMLEDPGAVETGGWLRSCLLGTGRAVWCLESIELLISQQAPDDTEADPDVSRMNLRIDVDRCAVRGSDAQFEPP
jgi:hypothetical protein